MAVEVSKRLFELFSSKNIAGYYDARKETVRPYLGEALFPATKTTGLTIKWLKGKGGAPVLLRPSAFDAHAPIRPRIPVKQIQNEMPFFRESMKIGEYERQQIMMASAAGDTYLTAMLDNIYADAYHLVLGANAANERLRLMLLSTGGISVTSDEVAMEYDYDFDVAKQSVTLTGTDQWNAPTTANPLRDFQKALQESRLGGARAIMTRNTFYKLIEADKVKGAMFAPAMIPTFVTPEQIRQYISSALGITLVVIDDDANTYTERVGGEEKKMFPDGVVSLIPTAGSLGNTVYGTTPEEADLLSSANANVSIVDTGVAITSIVETHPVNINTIVSQIAMPSCERINQLYIMNVYTP